MKMPEFLAGKGSRPGTRAAFPKARLVILVEAGTHLIFDALICPYKMGERVRALRLLRSVTKEMLLMWDAWFAFLCDGLSHAQQGLWLFRKNSVIS
jgi:hypothetical protein